MADERWLESNRAWPWYHGAVMDAPSASCSQHALREAVGVCVGCRRALCRDCITKLDGINYCRPCLEALRRKAPEASARPDRVPDLLAVGVGTALLSGLAWLMLEVLMPGAGLLP